MEPDGEAAPRYTNLNFYEMNSSPVKREVLQKDQLQDMGLGNGTATDFGKSKSKGKPRENELSL